MSNNNNNNLDPSEYTTQLSDAKPRFDCPIRISLPSHAPDRSSFMSNDQYLRRRIFSSGALVKNKTPLVRGDQEFAEMITVSLSSLIVLTIPDDDEANSLQIHYRKGTYPLEIAILISNRNYSQRKRLN